MRPRRFLPSIVLALLLPVSPGRATEGLQYFEQKVRPLLAERCLECHSAEKKIKGGLRLDLKDGWVQGGDSGPAIVPGDTKGSLLLKAVHYEDDDYQMPPKKKLAEAEIAVLEEWVKMGAPDPRTESALEKKQTGLSLEEGRKFWSYKPPQPHAAPAVPRKDWARSEIDRFVLAKLEEAGITPAADAAPEALVRRLYFTLLGMPPTPAQMDRFLKDAAADRQGAVGSLVDELLASPHFGEYWGRHWLDVARFAESSGGGRTLLFKDAWRYRDYVIESVNADVPLDRFIREQIAGDLLPWESPAEHRRLLAATGFLVVGPTNYEEQDKQQLRFDVIDEQLDTLGRAFLGQTIGCARCHDHKFDPVPQKDYYALAGIFASTRTLLNYTDNVAKWIAAPLPLEGAEEAAMQAHEQRLATVRAELAAAKKRLADAAPKVEKDTKKPGQPVAVSALPGLVVDEAAAKVVGKWKASTFTRSYVGDGYLHDENEGKGEKTITFTPTFPAAGQYEVRLAYSHAESRAKNVRVHIFHADGEDTVHVDQTKAPPIDDRFVALGRYRFEKDGAGYVLITNEGTEGYVTVDALVFLPEQQAAAVVAQVKEGTEEAAAAALKARVQELEAEVKALARTERPAAMSVADDPQPRGTELRIRGIEKQRGEIVPRGFLQVALTETAPAVPETSSGRRELADWIASNENPLTARVLVNRVWAWLFGAGIVRTVDNFGTTGELPSHPELLDALALRFVDEGWSLKKLVREIVTSRTWQLAVQKPTSADPENRFLGHANRRRLDAEQLRDAILTVSGKLELTVGGPNIQGAGDINPNDTSAQNVEYAYTFADFRRSVYTPAFRNKRLELFEAFDFGDINSPVGQRHVSTVAPQALFFLNHPFVAEQSRAAAERTLAEQGSAEDRLASAYRRTLGRAPTDAERQACLRFISSASTSTPEAELWAQLHQTLFASLDFRYLE